LQAITASLLRRLGYNRSETPAPSAGTAKPTRTVALLLRHLGYAAKRLAEPSAALLTGGIKAFQKDYGVRPDGKVSLQLLAKMLRAARAPAARARNALLKDLRIF
jgi:hypothetical protein